MAYRHHPSFGHEEKPDSRLKHPQQDVWFGVLGIDSGGYIVASTRSDGRIDQPLPDFPGVFSPEVEPPQGLLDIQITTRLRVPTNVPNPCTHDADPSAFALPRNHPTFTRARHPVQPPRAPTPPPPAGAQTRRSRRKHTADSDDEEWEAKRPQTALTDVDTNFVVELEGGPSRVPDAPNGPYIPVITADDWEGFGEDEEKENGIDEQMDASEVDEQADDSEFEYGEPDPADKKGKGVARGVRALPQPHARSRVKERSQTPQRKWWLIHASEQKESQDAHDLPRLCRGDDVECPFYGCNFVNSVKNMVDVRKHLASHYGAKEGMRAPPTIQQSALSAPSQKKSKKTKKGDAKKDAPAPKPLWPCKLEGCQRQSRPYSGYESLRRHHEEVHLKWMFLCPVQGCSVTCTREDTLRRHVLLIHKELTPEGENPESPEDEDENLTAGKKTPRRTGPSKK
ncbi:uncharacterized protein BXZ73DRAFT_81064 [Epithele typhae]|uniref:uncharacterized protein n=1 Tax=Epithele typhae TaxID=378194 RepID=UPI002007A577|nr:uncharacterized protein BXZ73DRAFT_81064 [Epithele typhae]KAH9916617.1 hypothetical protein BXZ73DRAFT_81064 [Epithele typhae]